MLLAYIPCSSSWYLSLLKLNIVGYLCIGKSVGYVHIHQRGPFSNIDRMADFFHGPRKGAKLQSFSGEFYLSFAAAQCGVLVVIKLV